MEPALISLDITPKTPADREKLARALQALAAEDGNLEVRAGVEPECTVISATSEAHLEEIVDRLKRNSGAPFPSLDLTTGAPRTRRTRLS
jgi:translation elongation factor EF-G